MPASKIVDKAEVIRWFEEGKTYKWMCEEYQRRYNIATVPSMWGNFRRRHGLVRRIVRDDNLIPWAIKDEHRWLNPVGMLRIEARRRAGETLTDRDEARLGPWLATRKRDDTVVHYDPDTDEGFNYVPRRSCIDKDLIREPSRKTTLRPNRDDQD